MRISFAGLILAFALFVSLAVAVEVCPAGNFYNPTSEACEKCPKGTFAESDGARTECTPCSPGTVALDSGSSKCELCGYATYEVNRISCSNCPQGSSSQRGSTSQDDCKPCFAGEIIGSLLPVCIPCFSGSYEVNRTVCKACPKGTFSNVQNASSVDTCKPCSAGSYSYKGADKCLNCLAGSYEINRTYCMPCPEGKFSKSGSATCSDCPSGTKAVKRATECQEKSFLETYDPTGYITGGVLGFILFVCIIKCKSCKKTGYDVETGPRVSLIYQNRR